MGMAGFSVFTSTDNIFNNSMPITPSPPGQAKGVRFEHGSVLGGKIRAARVSSQWKSTAPPPAPTEQV
jgi:hypothetical protein